MLLESNSFFVDLSVSSACTWLGVPAYSILGSNLAISAYSFW